METAVSHPADSGPGSWLPFDEKVGGLKYLRVSRRHADVRTSRQRSSRPPSTTASPRSNPDSFAESVRVRLRRVRREPPWQSPADYGAQQRRGRSFPPTPESDGRAW